MWHYKPADGYFGDPIPFFWDGVYHMFYLKAPLEPKRHGADFTHYAHVSTRDFLTWTEHKPVIFPEEGAPDAKSCWTGCVIHHDGVFYLFYTGHDRGHPTRPQSICLATSRDMENWEKSPDNPILLPDTNRFKISDWRDPFVFWSEPDQCFLMSITTMVNGADFYTAGALAYARSADLLHWEIDEVYYNPGNHGYPECSDLFELGGRHYVLMSIFHKTAYRFGPTNRGPWQTGRTDSFDGVMNYAAKSLSDGTNRFVVGWIRTRQGRRDSGGWEWGGHMAFPRQIVQDADGTLFSKLPDQFEAIRGEEIFSMEDKGSTRPVYGTWQAQDRGVRRLHSSPLYGELKLEATASSFDLELEFTLDPGTRSGGLIFGANGEDHPGYEVCVDLRLQQLLIRKHGQRFGCYVCQDVHVSPGETMRLRVIVEEDIVEAFLNGRYALASRCYQVGADAPLGFFIEEGSGALTRARVCALAEMPSLVMAAGG
jgi:beta-fructofuranosidase